MVTKSAKESAIKAPRPKKKESVVRRGGCITLPTIKAIESAYEKAKVDHPHLQSIGWARLVLPPRIKQTSGIKALAMLKEGKTANEIARGARESRRRSKSTVRNAKNLKMAKHTLRKDTGE